VSSVILQGCDYTLCLILVCDCTNILFAASTFQASLQSDSTEVQDFFPTY